MRKLLWNLLRARSLYRVLRSPFNASSIAFLILTWLLNRRGRS